MKTLNVPLMVGCLCALAMTASAQVIKVIPESSPNAAGPFRPIDPAAVQQNPDASWFTAKSQPPQFFRLRIEDVPPGPGAPILTSAVPREVYGRALKTLHQFSQSNDDTNRPPSDAIWENAVLAPFVCPIFDPGVSNGTSPALLEFKVIAGPPPPPLRGVLRNRSEDTAKDLGYILVSLTEDNFPVVSFSNEGLTPVEKLMCRAGTTQIKPIQFDNTLLVAEDERGRIIANFGSVPFKIPPADLAELNVPHDYEGDDDAGIDNRPRTGALRATHYASYVEFKEDFKTNQVYQMLRTRRATCAKEQWDIEKGIYPDVILINVNETRVILVGRDITSFRFFSEDGADVRLDELPNNGGLRLFALKPGDGRLTVQLATGMRTYAVGVRLPGAAGFTAASFTPGEQPPKFWYAGTWDDQPKYDQLEHDDWCPKVGCGPTAWAILFAWFEREHGVKGAFGNFTTTDAPSKTGSGNNQFVFPVMDDLHELCDVICTPFSDLGATEPSDMCEGGLGYTFTPRILGYIRRSWRMKWTIWDDCPEDGALECAEAIKKGYPGVVGLGWLWHYAVAYGYQRVDWKLTQNGPPLLIYRYLKCNMGWGDTVQWFNLCDTFFSSDFRIRNGPNAQ
jgi:hypothetical protein